MSMSEYETGFWGIPSEYWRGKVHAVKDGEPMCGIGIGPKCVYYFADKGINRSYISCKRCNAMLDQHPWREDMSDTIMNIVNRMMEDKPIFKHDGYRWWGKELNLENEIIPNMDGSLNLRFRNISLTIYRRARNGSDVTVRGRLYQKDSRRWAFIAENTETPYPAIIRK